MVSMRVSTWRFVGVERRGRRRIGGMLTLAMALARVGLGAVLLAPKSLCMAVVVLLLLLV